ncbi:MAG: TlyA family RNA methyltransferase [Thermotogota bacterium]|nr:TlyA family RNA methyltransferase [Thermotogota bacterium]
MSHYKGTKKRLDQLLVDRGFFSSRTKAAAEIMLGNVLVNEEKVTKTGKRFSDDCTLRLKNVTIPYVSRGALKLKEAFDCFELSVKDKACVDLGASTGGFTEILLQNGAKKVYAVDVGYGQLDWKIRSDPRVVSMDKTNARYLNKSSFEEQIQFITGDLSFISLTLILPVTHSILTPEGEGVFLIKPQFELPQDRNVKGIVKDNEDRWEAVHKVFMKCHEMGFSVEDFTPSPVKGRKGNVEYLVKISLPYSQEWLLSDTIVRERIFKRKDD